MDRAIDFRSRNTINTLPTLIPWAAVILFVFAHTLGAWLPYYGQAFFVVLVPLIWMMTAPLSQRLHGHAASFAWLGLLAIGYMGLLQSILPHTAQIDWGRWAERAAALAAALALLAMKPNIRQALSVMGAGCACAVIVPGVFNLVQPGMDWYGMGNVNYLVNVTAPPVVAWMVLMVADWRNGNRPRWSHFVVGCLGVVALLGYIFGYNRLAAGLTFAAGAAAVVWIWIWQRHRPTASALIALLGLAVVYLTIRLWGVIDLESPLVHRVVLYKSMLALGLDGLPFGWGHYGSMHLNESSQEIARSYILTGYWAFHAHNFWIDNLIDGGAPLLALLVGQQIIVIRHVLTITDREVQFACAALIAAAIVVLFFSIAYGTAVGDTAYHLILACVLLAPTGATSPFRTPRLRWLLWPLLFITFWSSIGLSRAATMHEKASLGVKWEAIKQQRIMMSTDTLYEAIDKQYTTKAKLEIAGQVIPPQEVADTLKRTAGQVSSQPYIALRAAGLKHFNLWQAATAEPDNKERQWALHQARYELLARFILLIDRFPFDRSLFATLERHLASDEVLQDIIPNRYRFALDAQMGRDIGYQPQLQRETKDLNDRIRLYVETYWAILHDYPWSEVAAPIQQLYAYHGGSPMIANLVLQAIIHAGIEPDFAWAAKDWNRLHRGLRWTRGTNDALQFITTPEQARRVQPLFERMLPLFYQSIESNDIINLSEHDNIDNIADQLYRVWKLSREAESTPSAEDQPAILEPAPAVVP